MRKSITTILASLLCLGILAGCTAQASDTANTTPDASKATSQESAQPSATSTPDVSASYDKLVSYKTEGYSKQSVADFNRSLLPENGNLSELLEAFADVTGAISTDDANYDFITLTLAASLDQLRSEQMDDKTGFSRKVIKKARPYEVLPGEEGLLPKELAYQFIFTASYSVQYTITDPVALTVADRDAALKAFCTELQSYIDGLSETDLMSGDIKKTVSSKATELANDLSSETLKLSCEIGSIEIHNSGTEVLH